MWELRTTFWEMVHALSLWIPFPFKCGSTWCFIHLSWTLHRWRPAELICSNESQARCAYLGALMGANKHQRGNCCWGWKQDQYKMKISRKNWKSWNPSSVLSITIPAQWVTTGVTFLNDKNSASQSNLSHTHCEIITGFFYQVHHYSTSHYLSKPRGNINIWRPLFRYNNYY